jgi:ribosomal protein L11 methyltransferase
VDALRRAGARAVERVGGRFEALLPAPESHGVQARVREAAGAIRASTSLGDPEIRWRWEPHDDWVNRWRSAQVPRRVTDRITVVPGPAPGADADSTPGTGVAAASTPSTEVAAAIVVRLDPSPAFGTAEHPTTRACLRLLDRHVRPGDRILDLGTGSGVLAIAAALLGARQVTAMDADPLACRAARANVEGNGVGRRVDVREREVRPGGLRRHRYDGVVANLQAVTLRPLIPDLARATTRDGWVVMSGTARTEREGIVAAARAAGLELGGEEPGAGWWTGWFFRTGRRSLGAPRR